MLNINRSLKNISFRLCFLLFCCFAIGQQENKYYKYVDSASIYIDDNSIKALSFLEEIPEPIEESIAGKAAVYYLLRAIIHDEFNEFTKYHQCAILAIKYAEKENNFCAGGEASIGLFSNLYFIEKDKTALKYIEKARSFFEKCDYEYGILDVEQVEAHAKFLDQDYNESNNMLLSKLDVYKSIDEDPYYQLFALYIITSNYISLNEFDKAHHYFNDYKSLKTNPLTIRFNYSSFEGAINCHFAESFFKAKQIDSTRFYLNSTSKSVKYMAVGALKSYYRLNADFNKHLGNIDKSKTYIDSLITLQKQMFDKTIEASFEVNDSLIKAETELKAQNEKEIYNSFLAGFILVFLLIISLISLYYYNKQKNKLTTYSHETNNSLTYLKSNNEQLAIKVHGLEEYIKNLKIEVKQISRTDSIKLQKERIKDLYKNLHINSSTILDKSESHLDLVNDLNIEFFNKIKNNYPQLNKTEIIICYYLFMDFSNKEIAVFLNTTIRSVESRRYRISKKINLIKKDTTLLEYLQNNYSDTLKDNMVL
ncbi:helix-turn-helix transcriptional regulator [Algibacter sp. R77976]|uniref:helix-turn-helix transcriptional regulator n=1 Tax=Algibacter sp. R77976 TaxID=3093873 RepID=UPI0037C64D27